MRKDHGGKLARMNAELEARISASYLREVVERLESFRSHPLGFRAAGTPEERAAARFVADEMRRLGLEDVEEEPVPVDAWRFQDAFVEAPGKKYECASMAGVPETPPEGVTGELAFVRRGGRGQIGDLDVRGRIVLVDWSDEALWPYQFGLELGLRGAAALIVTSLAGGPYYQAPGALGTFNAMWHPQAPPLVTMRKEDAEDLLERGGATVRVFVSAPTSRGAEAANVVGTLPGSASNAPLLVAAHHDAWFGGAFGDATAVAAVLALARAFAETRTRARYPIGCISHPADEYGPAAPRNDCRYRI